MAKSFSQLIWLGAGSATQPANIIGLAENVLLIEARSAACQQLSKQFSQHHNITIKQALISEQGGDLSFTEYNLAEYSAINSASGLKQLFPGLKALETQVQQSETIAALLQPLALKGNSNVLIIDIADISLGLLKQLQAEQLLKHFSQLWLQASDIALYKGSATEPELVNWLQQQGFLLSAKDSTDPDLPWLQFSLNPLWQPLQQSRQEYKQLVAQHQLAEQAKADLAKQVDTAKLQLTAEKQQAEQAKTELAKQLESAKQQLATESQQAGQAKADLAKQLESAKQQLVTEKQQAEQTKADLAKQVESAKQQLAAEKQQAEQVKAELAKQLETAKQQLAAEKQQAGQAKAELEKQLAAAKHQAGSEQQQATENSNKLLAELEQVKKSSNKLLLQLEEQKHQYEQKLADVSKQLANSVSNNETLQQQFNAAKISAEKTQAELNGQITGMDAELKQALQQLQAADQQLSSASEQAKKLELTYNALSQKLEQANTAHAMQLADVKQQTEQAKQDAVTQQQKLAKENGKLQADFGQVAKHAATRLEKISLLEKTNRQLNETNEQLTKRQRALEHEMLKAQAQIDIIKDLLLKP